MQELIAPGLFKNLKAQLQVATMGGPTAPPGVPILNPTPQEEVDRLLDAGGEARGVVMGSRHDMSDGDRFDEAKGRRKGWDLDSGLEGITQSRGMLKDTFGRGSATGPPAGLPSGDPLRTPVGAQRYGVPPGAWPGFDAGWMQPIMTSPALSQQLGTDLEAAQRDLGVADPAQIRPTSSRSEGSPAQPEARWRLDPQITGVTRRRG